MNRDELAKLILLELYRRCEVIKTRPKPPAWKTWEAWPDALDRERTPSTANTGRATRPRGLARPRARRPAGCVCSAPFTAWPTPD